MAPAARRHQLEQQKVSRPPHTYNPTRQRLPDVVNATEGFLPAGTRPSWGVIDAVLTGDCKSEGELNANRLVCNGLYRYFEENRINARSRKIFPLTIGMERVRYWEPYILDISGRAVIMYFDPRKAKGLTEAGRRFVFSAMHHHIRVNDPDLFDARLLIVQFGQAVDGFRPVIPQFDESVELHSYEELDAMVVETYRVWAEVLQERADKERRTGTGGRFGLI